MEDAKIKTPPHIATGTLYREIESLPGDQAALVLAQPQAERERIMALNGAARDTAIETLKVKPAEKTTTTKKEN